MGRAGTVNLYWYNIVVIPILQTVAIVAMCLLFAAVGDVLVEWIDKWR